MAANEKKTPSLEPRASNPADAQTFLEHSFALTEDDLLSTLWANPVSLESTELNNETFEGACADLSSVLTGAKRRNPAAGDTRRATIKQGVCNMTEPLRTLLRELVAADESFAQLRQAEGATFQVPTNHWVGFARNFTRLSFSPCTGVSIVASAAPGQDGPTTLVFPIEVRSTGATWPTGSVMQLLVTMLSCQRSIMRGANGRWYLDGAAIDKDEAYFIRVEAGCWWDTMASIRSVLRFKFDSNNPAGRARQILRFLQRAGRELLPPGIAADCTELFRLPNTARIFTYPDDSIRCTEHPHIALCTFGVAKAWRTRVMPTQLYESREVTELNDNEEVLTKVVSLTHYSSARFGLRTLTKLLTSLTKSIDDQQGGNDETWPQRILRQYLWILDRTDSSWLITMRYLGRFTLDAPQWHTNAEIRQAFYDGVCVPAMRVTALGYVHGDVRPSNIVVSADGRQCHLVDWDTVRPAGQPRFVSNKRGEYPHMVAIFGLDAKDEAIGRLLTAYQLRCCIAIASGQSPVDGVSRFNEEMWQALGVDSVRSICGTFLDDAASARASVSSVEVILQKLRAVLLLLVDS